MSPPLTLALFAVGLLAVTVLAIGVYRDVNRYLGHRRNRRS